MSVPMLRRLSLAVLAAGLLLAPACDKASPVAPEGTVLTISANPATITARGTSTIIVSGRKANGTPLAEGTLVRLSTSLGTIDSSVPVDSTGTARATLRGDGRSGTAKVKASAGPSEEVEVEVAIGSPGSAISLLVTPSNIPDSGGTIELRALVRDGNGQPQPGAQVNFQTEVGRLRSEGRIVEADANGEAVDRLTVTESDLASFPGENFEVTAQVGNAEGALVEATAEVTIGSPAGTLTFQASPTTLPQEGGAVQLLAIVRNEQGRPVANSRVTFVTEAGRLASGGGAVFTNAAGEARDTLTLTSTDVTALNDDSFTVRAQVAGGGGELIEREIEIAVGSRAGSITLQASPSSIPETGGSVGLLALVRNTQGAPLANAAVNFTTEVGTLASGGSIKFTDSRGEVRDTLQVTQANLDAIAEDRFDVSAQVGGSGGTLISDSFEVRVQRAAPVASFVVHRGGNATSVFFENTTTGTEPITYAWDFQGDGIIDSTVKDPVFDYGSGGSYTVRLTATNSSGSDTEIRTISVPVD
jgi:hypothetical protein